MAARKKKKKALPRPARKSAGTPPRVRNKVGTRTTQRTQRLTPLDYSGTRGVTPEGMVEKHLAALKELGLALDGSLQTLEPGLLEDAAEMLERPEEDAAALAKEKTPVLPFHFKLLALHVARLGEGGARRGVVRSARTVTTEDLDRATATVVTRRNKMCMRAKACGVPVNLFEIRRARSSPEALYARLVYLLPQIGGLVDQFDSPPRARELLADLQHANAELGTLVMERKGHTLQEEDTREDRRLVLHSLHSLMLWMSGYGKATFMDDEDGLRRWRLDKMYPHSGTADATDEPATPPRPSPLPRADPPTT